jgi:succinoglycan biosynthesis transport protein ExoP
MPNSHESSGFPSNPAGPGASPPLQGEVCPPAGAAAAPLPLANAHQFPTFLQLLLGFRRCWLRAVTLGVLAAAAAAVGIWFVVPVFSKVKARALLYVDPHEGGVVFSKYDSGMAFASYKKTQIALVKSRLVLSAALRQPEVANLRLLRQQPDPVEWLEQNLVVDYSYSPDILTITLSGENDDELKAIVGAVAKKYMDEIVDKEHNKRLEQADKLKALKSRYEELVAAKKRSLQEVIDAANNNNDATADLRKQERARADLDATEKELVAIRSQVLRLKAMASIDPNQPIPDSILGQQINQDPGVRRLMEQIGALEDEKEQIRARTSPAKFPQFSARTQEAIERLKKDLEGLRTKLKPKIEEALRLQYQARAESQKGEVEALTRFEAMLNGQIDTLSNEARVGRSRSRDLTLVDQLREDVAQLDDLLRLISSKAEVMKVENDTPPRVRMFEPDPVVSHPDTRKRQYMGAAGGGIGALVLVVFGLCWWETRSLGVNSPDEVVRGLGLPLMGTLPLMPARSRSRADANDWHSMLLESVDSIRTMLLHVARTGQLRVVMITSALGGEGKTSLSSHVATSLARAGRKTLLIDCDLRKPSLQRVFELPRTEGFCELLRGEVGLAEAVQATQVDGLAVIAAGEVDAVALGRLAQGAAAGILHALREQYDFILVDSAPILPVTDSLLLAQEVDGVLLSVLRDVSRLSRVHAAHERLAFLGVHTLGMVVTGIPEADMYRSEYRYLGHHEIRNDGSAEGAEGAADEEPSGTPATEES